MGVCQLKDVARTIYFLAEANHHVPEVFGELCYRWYKDGLSGVGGYLTDEGGNPGPLVGVIVAGEPHKQQLNIKYLWVAHGFHSSDLDEHMFAVFMSKVPGWVKNISLEVPEENKWAITVAKNNRMTARGLRRREGQSDLIVFGRPNMLEMGR